MTTKPNPLAVIAFDRSHAQLWRGSYLPEHLDRYKRESEEARNSIAEVVEAARRYQDSMDGTKSLEERCAAGRRLEAALAAFEVTP